MNIDRQDRLHKYIDIVTLFEYGFRVTVKARPSSQADREIRVVTVAEGKRALEVSVAAVAEDGRANKAILARFAKELGIKVRDVELKSGKTSRVKCIEVTGDPAILHNKLAVWLDTIKKEK